MGVSQEGTFKKCGAVDGDACIGSGSGWLAVVLAQSPYGCWAVGY